MNADERFERAVQAAQADLAAGIQDALADWGEDPPVDDIAHDIAQSIALGIRSTSVRAEFCRREGIINPAPPAPSGNRALWETQRKPLNDETSSRAVHGGDPWTNAEDARLLTWDHTEYALLGLALELGRSLEACRQRYYTLHRAPRDGASRTTTRGKRARAAGGRTAPAQPLPDPCPVCGLVHPGEC